MTNTEIKKMLKNQLNKLYGLSTDGTKIELDERTLKIIRKAYKSGTTNVVMPADVSGLKVK